jgi:hypothetical protein
VPRTSVTPVQPFSFPVASLSHSLSLSPRSLWLLAVVLALAMLWLLLSGLLLSLSCSLALLLSHSQSLSLSLSSRFSLLSCSCSCFSLALSFSLSASLPLSASLLPLALSCCCFLSSSLLSLLVSAPQQQCQRPRVSVRRQGRHVKAKRLPPTDKFWHTSASLFPCLCWPDLAHAALPPTPACQRTLQLWRSDTSWNRVPPRFQAPISSPPDGPSFFAKRVDSHCRWGSHMHYCCDAMTCEHKCKKDGTLQCAELSPTKTCCWDARKRGYSSLGGSLARDGNLRARCLRSRSSMIAITSSSGMPLPAGKITSKSSYEGSLLGTSGAMATPRRSNRRFERPAWASLGP